MDWNHRKYALESAEGVIDAIPTMMKAPELDLLYSIAKNRYTGSGIIVDAGIFMGASTKCFLQGILSQGDALNSDRPLIHSFERGKVTPAMKGYEGFESYEVGDDYSKLVKKLFEDAHYVNFNFGDIQDIVYFDKSIEILFLDILKTPNVMQKCNELFFPNLQVGKGIVVQQDFYWPFGWWINAWMERWNEHFEYIDFAETSLVCEYVKELPSSAYDPNEIMGTSEDEMVDILKNPNIPAFRLDHAMAQRLKVVNYLMFVKNYARAFEELDEFMNTYFAKFLVRKTDAVSLRMKNDINRMRGTLKKSLQK